ncbi:hypothetical protein ACFL08_04515 [Patescibacteria group bacterium]
MIKHKIGEMLMTYSEMTKNAKGLLGRKYKQAKDIAVILDDELTQVKPDSKGRYGFSFVLSSRLEAFNLLCAIFVQAEIDPPPMEEGLWKSSLPAKPSEKQVQLSKARSKFIFDQFADQMKNGAAADKVSKLRSCLDFLPGYWESGSISLDGVLALISEVLVDDLGVEPLRPDYSKISVPDPIHPTGPSKPTKILIVDDSIEEIIRTIKALAGIPNFEIDFFLLEEGDLWAKFSDSELTVAMQRSLDEVEKRTPDVVFMDQAMGQIKGHELVSFIKGKKGEDSPIFVGNTGGMPKELDSVGCLSNFAKGHNKGTIRQVMDRLNS